jgi:EAL domain-containing protein (putative c-di-GMP-specific phosphodiesterase class I)
MQSQSSACAAARKPDLTMSQASIVKQSAEAARRTARMALAGAAVMVMMIAAERTLFQAEQNMVAGLLLAASLGGALLLWRRLNTSLNNAEAAYLESEAPTRHVAERDTVVETNTGLRHADEHELRSAIAAGEIIPYFQPIVDVATRRIRGFEALARWHHPTRGIVAPIDFIPLAEATGELANLTMSMLRQACVVARDLPTDLTIAVNVSPQQIQDEGLSTKILKVLTETGFPPHRLEIELTENALVTDFAAAKRVIQSLKNLGIRVALDDFGTGYSSLFYLSELQFDKIKIDRSFVRTLHDRSESAKIINAIVGPGRSLGVPTMAEGVETERDAAVLGDIGCLTAQGYLYSRPVPADKIAGLLLPVAGETKTAA